MKPWPSCLPVPRLVCLAVVGFVAAAGLTGCGQAPAASGKPTVVATTTMIADLAATLGGDAVQVVGIMKSGEDPHVYDVRPNDARLIARAELILTNGLNLEATLGAVIANNAEGRVIALGEAVEFDAIGASYEGSKQGAPDPHIWMDPTIWARCAEATRDALIDLVPEEAEAFTARTDAYLKELEALDTEIKALFAAIPAEQRVIITSHDAFAYFGRAYEIEVHGVIGISTEQQPRPQDIEALENLVRDRSVKAVFIETSTSATLNQIVEKVAANTGAAVGGTLFSDALGDPGGAGGTYLGMMRHNAQTVAGALRR